MPAAHRHVCRRRAMTIIDNHYNVLDLARPLACFLHPRMYTVLNRIELAYFIKSDLNRTFSFIQNESRYVANDIAASNFDINMMPF